jgi:calcium-dependent protein kinase
MIGLSAEDFESVYDQREARILIGSSAEDFESVYDQREARIMIGSSMADFESVYDVSSAVVLGTGICGAVKCAMHRQSGETHAVKRINRKRHPDACSELNMYLSLRHPRIARLEQAFETSDAVVLAMEHLKGGDVFERVLSHGRLNEADAATTLRQILEAVEHLHDRGITHRDLKIENFVYEREDANDVKLVDFGFATACREGEKLYKRCGTLRIVAPEVLHGCYDRRADLWSVGVATYMMLVGAELWGPIEEVTRRMIERGETKFAKAFDELSKEAQDFVKSLLVRDPSKRLSAAQALQHPWFERAMDCPPAVF